VLPATRDLLLKKVREVFPLENPAEIIELLDSYGVEPYERECERVQLAILKLSGGSIEELLSHLEVAKRDYRDVLAWAEFPHEMKLSANEMHAMPPEAAKDIRDKDSQQYLEWLQRKADADEKAN
jgi:hypothetical protein